MRDAHKVTQLFLLGGLHEFEIRKNFIKIGIYDVAVYTGFDNFVVNPI